MKFNFEEWKNNYIYVKTTNLEEAKDFLYKMWDYFDVDEEDRDFDDIEVIFNEDIYIYYTCCSSQWSFIYCIEEYEDNNIYNWSDYMNKKETTEPTQKTNNNTLEQNNVVAEESNIITIIENDIKVLINSLATTKEYKDRYNIYGEIDKLIKIKKELEK